MPLSMRLRLNHTAFGRVVSLSGGPYRGRARGDKYVFPAWEMDRMVSSHVDHSKLKNAGKITCNSLDIHYDSSEAAETVNLSIVLPKYANNCT